MDPNFNQLLHAMLNPDPKLRTSAAELRKISTGMLGTKVNSHWKEIFPVGTQYINRISTINPSHNNNNNNNVDVEHMQQLDLFEFNQAYENENHNAISPNATSN